MYTENSVLREKLFDEIAASRLSDYDPIDLDEALGQDWLERASESSLSALPDSELFE